ncbi:MAG: DUF378 domain-containing protein [Betaproteobacteria bacterium]|nr:DUF378 domain-containing protein [Betaproteobacteria bacterium]
MHVLSTADWVAFTLMVMGGLNWGLVGAFSFDPITALFGEHSMASRVAYVLIGLSSVYALYAATKLAQPL